MPSANTVATSSNGSLKPPVGISDFGELYREGYTFVDKSLLIREVLEDSAKVTLITRPRRFGKTLNLSMLHHFFASEVNGHSTRKMFDWLAVSHHPQVMEHQGRHPVIFVTLKDIKEKTFRDTSTKLGEVLASLYDRHRDVGDSPRLSDRQRDDFQLIRNRQASVTMLANSLKLLCDYLYAHHGTPPILLIDEYDSPMHAAYSNGYFDDMAGFMRGLLGAALKDNSSLHKAIVTGILRVSKESLFSGLNNIEVNTVLSPEYSRWFGFTEHDLMVLLLLLSREPPESDGIGERIRAWYNGYRFGEQVVYNPWSILSCLKHDGLMQPYWVNTSDNALLKEAMGSAVAEVKRELEKLIRGNTLEKAIDPNLVFSDLDRGGDVLWSLLLFTGYLTASEPRSDHLGYITCQVRIPNQEVLGLYERNIKEWFTDKMSTQGYAELLTSLLAGNLDEFKARLEDYLRDSMSLFDTSGHHPEKFYHGLVLGLMCGLKDTHVVYSNRESGYGRYDMALLPKADGRLGLVMEFKRVDDPAQLESSAEQALRQIDERWYAAELRQYSVAQVLKIGMAFSGKRVGIRSARSQ